MFRPLSTIASLLVLCSCADAPSSDTTLSDVPSLNKYDSWVGKWTGPEGTYLNLVKQPDGYAVNIQSLDSLDSYKGVPVENGIAFTRKGTVETLRNGSGRETGMKWLLEKNDCLVVNLGEGFCRD